MINTFDKHVDIVSFISEKAVVYSEDLIRYIIYMKH